MLDGKLRKPSERGLEFLIKCFSVLSARQIPIDVSFYQEVLNALLGEGYHKLAKRLVSERAEHGRIRLREEDLASVKAIEDASLSL